MKVRELAVCGLMTAVMAVFSQISVPLPVSPVPLTLGVLGVYAASALQRPVGAVMSMGAYLLLGAVGLPVFAGFQGGLGTLLGPTGGFLLAYPLMALVVSFGAGFARKKERWVSKGLLALSMLLSLVICYGLGAGWLAISRELSLEASLKLAVWPFVIGDLCKIAAAAFLLPMLRTRLAGFLN